MENFYAGFLVYYVQSTKNFMNYNQENQKF